MPKDIDVAKAATGLYDAMKGFGCNDKKLVDILAPYIPDPLTSKYHLLIIIHAG